MQSRAPAQLLKVLGGVAVLGVASAWVAAQSGPGTTRALVPYQGHVERDGVALDVPVDLRVGLFLSSAAGAGACLAGSSLSGCGVWADQFDAVEVRGGAFSVVLGSGLDLPDALFQHNALHVGLAVADVGGAFVAMQGVQRLGSAPYAVRSERSNDLYVNGSVGVGIAPQAGTKLRIEAGSLYVRDKDDDILADIAQFMANNQSQGVGVGYNRLAAVGTNPNQHLHLVPKGTGAVYVDGPSRLQNVQNLNGVESTYYREGGRYLARATYQAQNPVRRWVEIPEAVLHQYCGDPDGCTITLGMKNWSASEQRSTSIGPFHFSYGPTGQWRRSTNVVASLDGQQVFFHEGTDGDGNINHVVKEYDCYFTDGFYAVGAGGSNDSQRGMGLLNWNAHGYTGECWLTIDD